MQQLKKIALLFFMFLLVGCGIEEENYDTSGFQTIDNSELSPFFTDYGYFGENVIFGEITIVGIWTLYDTQTDSILYAKFDDDGTGMTSEGAQYTYGLAKSGLSINLSTGDTIVITTSEIYKVVDDFDCYRVNIVGSTTSTVDMCPDH